MLESATKNDGQIYTEINAWMDKNWENLEMPHEKTAAGALGISRGVDYGAALGRAWKEMSMSEAFQKSNMICCDVTVSHIPAGCSRFLVVGEMAVEAVLAVDYDRDNVMLQMFRPWRPFEAYHTLLHLSVTDSRKMLLDDVRVRVLDDLAVPDSVWMRVGGYVPMPVILWLPSCDEMERAFWGAFQRVIVERKIHVGMFRFVRCGFDFDAVLYRACTTKEQTKYGDYVMDGVMELTTNTLMHTVDPRFVYASNDVLTKSAARSIA